ncbi:MAG: hypothetical protein V1856_02595 [Candidatus Liptonbacteria bacterium]
MIEKAGTEYVPEAERQESPIASDRIIGLRRDKISEFYSWGIGKIYNKKDSDADRLAEVAGLIGAYSIPERDEALSNLQKLQNFKDREDFERQVMTAVAPLIGFIVSHPGEGEKIVREAMVLSYPERKPVNQLLAHDISDGTLYLHILPNWNTPPGEQKGLLIDGLEAIARILDKNPEIKKVAGGSLLVAKQPGIAERLGFTIKGIEIDKTKRRTGEVEMSRDDFLAKYLK